MNILTKNIFASSLDEKTIKRRIETLLSNDNHEWALYFCESIINHPNTIEIRKLIGDIRIEILRKYHNIIIKTMNNDIEYFSEFIKNLKLLNQKANNISHSIIDMGIITVDNKDDIKNLEDSFNIYHFLLKQTDSPLLLEAKRRFDISSLEILKDNNDDNYMQVYYQEKDDLESYLNYYFWFRYHIFLEKKNRHAVKISNLYKEEVKNKFYKAKRQGKLGSYKNLYF